MLTQDPRIEHRNHRSSISGSHVPGIWQLNLIEVPHLAQQWIIGGRLCLVNKVWLSRIYSGILIKALDHHPSIKLSNLFGRFDGGTLGDRNRIFSH